ncbi:MAG: restriction endonuclease [Paraburkholderia sp.]|uniref:BsuBI/PstI family type II restriction endonuclease n=1 Tax=Paraburkholderia sp. TaxID=1926495 RepID=UPI0012196FB3|nr:BsuBI/PstI family type II restriction endonuclease [Paraburkholderia sp.]TAL95249.1 MAG: restriction endonuclease [Paraburkholderia sp.]
MPDRLSEARAMLAELGLPPQQQNKISGLTLLALCRVTLDSDWSQARRESLTIRKGIMDYVGEVLGNPYAENSREQFRRKVLHQFVQAGICLYNPDDATLATNSQKNHYAMSNEALVAIRRYGTKGWPAARDKFLAQAGSLAARYAAPREHEMVPVMLPDGRTLTLSPGKHNEVQAAIIEEFAPRFAPGSMVLYLGDTAHKALHIDSDAMVRLGIPLNQHDKMPDVMLYDPNRNWLFLVEAVTSHGPMSPKRLVELHKMLAACTAGPVFVSAFPDMSEFKKHAADIAWDTEVWLVEVPDHLMHFNGDRFLGPR